MQQRPNHQVCHVTSVHIPLDGRVFYHECRSLAEGYDVSLVCFDDGAERELSGVTISPVSQRPRTRRARWSALPSLVKAAEETGADLYHFHDPELIPEMRALKGRTGAPVIYDIHESYRDAVTQRSWIPAAARPLVARLAGRLERRNVFAFDALVVADEALRAEFSAIHPNVTLVRNYPPLDLFPGRASLDSGRPTLLYTGSISLVRGLREMLQVIRTVRAEIPSARLVLAGKPTEDAVPVLQAALTEMPETLEFLGPVPYDGLGALLADATIGLSLLQPHPKYEKNVPTKVFDYMAAGVPYVASSSKPLKEITAGVGGRLVKAGDSAAASAAVLELLGDMQELRATGARGRDLAEQQLNWTPEENALLGLYRELLP